MQAEAWAWGAGVTGHELSVFDLEGLGGGGWGLLEEALGDHEGGADGLQPAGFWVGAGAQELQF